MTDRTVTNPDIDQLLSHDAWLRSLLRGLLDEHAIDDVVQQTWIAALQRPWRSLRRPRAWLGQVARNLAAKDRRAAARRKSREVAAARSESLPSTEESLQALAAQRQVTKALMELAEPYRTTVLLRYHRDRSTEEIAADLGTSPANVRQRLSRGLSMMRQRVAEEYGSDWQSSRPVAGLLALLDVPRPVAAVGSSWLAGVFVMNQSVFLFAAALILAVVALFWFEPFGSTESPATPNRTEPRIAIGSDVPETPPEPATTATDRKRVTAESAGQSPRYHGTVLDLTGQPVPFAPIGHDTAGSGFVRLAEADASGRFELAPQAAEITLGVGAGYATVRGVRLDSRRDPTRELLLVAAPAVAIEGEVVTDDGEPLADVEIHVDSGDLTRFPRPVDDTERTHFISTTTDENGRFALPGLPAGHAIVRFKKNGFRGADLEIEATTEGYRVVTLRRVGDDTWFLRGQVVDHRGRSVADALVGIGMATTRTDRFGAFSFEFVHGQSPGDERSLYVAKPGLRTKVIEDFERLVEGTGTERTLEVQLDGPTLTITGRVLDADGRPSPGVAVYLWNQYLLDGQSSAEDLAAQDHEPFHTSGGSVYAAGTTDANGRFTIHGLDERDYTLRVLDPSTMLTMTSAPIAAGTTVELRWPVDALVPELSGRVVSRDGPVAGATVAVQSEVYKSHMGTTSQYGASVRTDAGGNFLVERVPRNGSLLRVSGEGIVSRRVDVEPRDDGTMTIEVRRRRHFRVAATGAPEADRFRILDASGQPMPIYEFTRTGSSSGPVRGLEDGNSAVFAVGDDATTLVLLNGDTEIARQPIRFGRDQVTVFRR